MKILLILLCFLAFTGCASAVPAETATATTALETTAPEPAETTMPTEEAQPIDPIQELLNQMSLEERVGQLFLARCNAETALYDIAEYHLGGFVLFGQDFENQTPDSLGETLCAYQDAARIPLLLAVDEEGGTVTRISQYSAFRDAAFPSLRQAFAAGGLEQVLSYETEKCMLLASLQIHVNLGPVCDISTDSGAFMYLRSLGQDAQTTAAFVSQTVQLMDTYGIGSVLKHFPGYGNNTDTHTGIAVDSRSLEQLEGKDLIPFAAGIQAGCGAVMMSHTIVEALDAELPVSLSPAAHQYLRESMGFNGVIVTDDLAMEAITRQSGVEEAAVLAILAGNNLLCATDYAAQYQAVLSAVLEGRIDFDTLNSAVLPVLEWKMQLGLIS